MSQDPDPIMKSMFPFAFPGSVPEEETPEPPPLHDDMEDLGFFEIFRLVFDQMKPTESLIDTVKRIKNSGSGIDDIAKWISELYTRGEVDIFERDWILIGISAGAVSMIIDMKWDLLSEGKITGPFTSEELGKRHRVLCALDSQVKKVGTEEWFPIEKIKFGLLNM